MLPRSFRHARRAAGLLAAVSLAARPLCAQAAPAPAAAAAPRATAADVRFMQDMLGHHAQALVLTALVPPRSSRADVRAVAERIAASQGDEMALVRRWLEARGAAVPAVDTTPNALGHAGMDHGATAHGAAGPGAMGHGAMARAAMPGMLTAAELARLRALRGPAFDRAFLAGMIRHHEGALAMVAALLAAPGAARDAALFRFASDVDADQRAEVARMRRMLAAPPR